MAQVIHQNQGARTPRRSSDKNVPVPDDSAYQSLRRWLLSHNPILPALTRRHDCTVLLFALCSACSPLLTTQASLTRLFGRVPCAPEVSAELILSRPVTHLLVWPHPATLAFANLNVTSDTAWNCKVKLLVANRETVECKSHYMSSQCSRGQPIQFEFLLVYGCSIQPKCPKLQMHPIAKTISVRIAYLIHIISSGTST